MEGRNEGRKERGEKEFSKEFSIIYIYIKYKIWNFRVWGEEYLGKFAVIRFILSFIVVG